MIVADFRYIYKVNIIAMSQYGIPIIILSKISLQYRLPTYVNKDI